MGIVTVHGDPITGLCTVDGTPIYKAVNLSGETIWQDWAEMPTDIRAVLDDAMARCANYIAANPGAYAFPVITDGHKEFSRRETAYITQQPEQWSRFLLEQTGKNHESGIRPSLKSRCFYSSISHSAGQPPFFAALCQYIMGKTCKKDWKSAVLVL